MFETQDLYSLWKEDSLLNSLLDTIGFTDIYMSPLTIALLVLFFVNLLVVTVNRFPVMLKRAYFMGEMPSFTAEQVKTAKAGHVIVQEGNSKVGEQLKIFFKKKRWYFSGTTTKDTFLAIKNRTSPIGFLLFHLSFFLCLAGALMIAYTRFSGNLPLTEGQSFEGDIEQFRVINREPRIWKRLGALKLYVEKVQPFYEREVPTELVVSLQATYRDRTTRRVLLVNEPLHAGPMSILVQNIGISPLFIIRGPTGKQIDAAYVSLNVLGGAEDTFTFETDRRFNFIVKFFPDYVKENGHESTRSVEMKNPAMRLVVGKDNKVIYQGTIREGETAQIGNFTISFEDIRYWVEFLIVREYGKIPLIAGFIIASIGLIMRLVFYQKRLRLAVEHGKEGASIFIDGKSEYFMHSFKDELESLVSDLDEFLRLPKT
jgi:cytochrome c biogenesis protein ResB